MNKLTYHINRDERGEFYADVRNSREKTIFEIRDFEIFEDGFMRHKDDTRGLLDYLQHLGLANSNSTLK